MYQNIQKLIILTFNTIFSLFRNIKAYIDDINVSHSQLQLTYTCYGAALQMQHCSNETR